MQEFHEFCKVTVEEFVNLAKQLGEEPPAGLADPGGWLVDFLKRKSRNS